MTKAEAMEAWANLEPDQPILKKMKAIPYKSTGSTYGTCGIRIDGTPEFVDAVLSHLKELLGGEDVETRLGLSRTKVECKLEGHSFHNKCDEAEVCYIRLHERGGEGAMCQAIIKDIKAKSKKRKRAA